jgi:hypothetical protein
VFTRWRFGLVREPNMALSSQRFFLVKPTVTQAVLLAAYVSNDDDQCSR